MDDHVAAPFPLLHVDLNHDPIGPALDFSFLNHLHHQHTSPKYTSSSSSSSSHELFPPPQPHQGGRHLHRVSLDDKLILVQGGGPHGCPFVEDAMRGKNRADDRDHDLGRDHAHAHPHEYCSAKWMSSKTRIMKKMTTSMGKPSSAIRKLGSGLNYKASTIPPQAQDVQEINSTNSNRSSSLSIESKNNPIIIRVCADCNTTKTPLWRSGPTGPKTLCNACGIRQRKARRAMAAAANGEPPPQQNPAPTQNKKKKMKKKKERSSSSESEDGSDMSEPQQKKPKALLHPPIGSRKVCFEEFVGKLSEWISDFRGAFPQDEKEAAILLMALSNGIVQAE